MKTKHKPKSHLGRKLIELREALGWTMYRLGKESGVDPSIVARIESGTRTDPAWSTMTALARALGVPLETFVQAE
jgi:transcriptional regulator with XRE-family HTH domain